MWRAMLAMLAMLLCGCEGAIGAADDAACGQGDAPLPACAAVDAGADVEILCLIPVGHDWSHPYAIPDATTPD